MRFILALFLSILLIIVGIVRWKIHPFFVSMTDVTSAVENVGNIEISMLEKGLPILATTAAGAPMIGFLGTVTGMVKAFMSMASEGANVDVTSLSTGIYEALVTTVGGLVVGIIAMFAYNYLTTLIKGVINKMEMRIMEFMDILNEPAA